MILVPSPNNRVFLVGSTEEYIFEFNVENLDDEIQTIIQFELPTLFNITDCSSGDINCDFEINITDILLLVDFILQESIPTLNQIEYSDIDLNGILNIIDILNLIQLILSSP